MDVFDELEQRDLMEDAKRVARAHHVTVEEVFGRGKGQMIVRARHAFWAHMSGLGFSGAQIAKICRVDHTTVDYGLRKARAA